MKFNWKILLITLVGAFVDILPTLLEDLNKSPTRDSSRVPGAQPTTSDGGNAAHPLQHLKRRATD
jgi:hypothetical protein